MPAFFAATFVGGLCIPLSLIILGASFARMSIPKRLSTLPIPAMIMVTLSKEVLVPVVGEHRESCTLKAKFGIYVTPTSRYLPHTNIREQRFNT